MKGTGVTLLEVGILFFVNIKELNDYWISFSLNSFIQMRFLLSKLVYSLLATQNATSAATYYRVPTSVNDR